MEVFSKLRAGYLANVHSPRGAAEASHERVFKYAVVLAAGLAMGSHVPGLVSLEDVGERAWLDPVSNVIKEALALSKPDATAVPVDLNAAAG
jgi:hypothetical protein